jgi:hypothetical protein
VEGACIKECLPIVSTQRERENKGSNKGKLITPLP